MTQFIVSIKNILSKETKRHLVFLFGSVEACCWNLPQVPISSLMSSGHPEVLVHVQKSELQGFAMSHTAPANLQGSSPQRPLKYRIRCPMGFGFQGAAPSTGTLLMPALLAQCSLNLGEKRNQAGKAEVWGRRDTKRQNPAPTVLFFYSLCFTSPKFYNLGAQFRFCVWIQWILFFSIWNTVNSESPSSLRRTFGKSYILNYHKTQGRQFPTCTMKPKED